MTVIYVELVENCMINIQLSETLTGYATNQIPSVTQVESLTAGNDVPEYLVGGGYYCLFWYTIRLIVNHHEDS